MIAYLFTTFPKSSEMFMQRDIAALKARGAPLRIYSIWGGEDLRGIPVERFNKWRLELFWLIPYESWRRPEVLRQLLRGLCTRPPPSWINFWENMLGAGFACVYARSFRRDRPALIHAAWTGAPATAAWLLWRIDGHRFSAGAHAYDIFEHGGDWWLAEKLEHAKFVQTSSEYARRAIIDRGLAPEKIICIRSGIERIPALKPLRSSRVPLRILCVARLVEKKGLERQLRIYAALKAAGMPFTARIVGDGPLRSRLEQAAGSLGIAASVTFSGQVPPHEVWEHLAWADAFLHTGIIAPSGDRDGIPNVILEAIAAGVPVLTTATAATTEAVIDGVTGMVLAVDDPAAWVSGLRRIASDDVWAERLRSSARKWLEEHFDLRKNADRLLHCLSQAAEGQAP